jgi:hypothetical protein
VAVHAEELVVHHIGQGGPKVGVSGRCHAGLRRLHQVGANTGLGQDGIDIHAALDSDLQCLVHQADRDRSLVLVLQHRWKRAGSGQQRVECIGAGSLRVQTTQEIWGGRASAWDDSLHKLTMNQQHPQPLTR